MRIVYTLTPTEAKLIKEAWENQDLARTDSRDMSNMMVERGLFGRASYNFTHLRLTPLGIMVASAAFGRGFINEIEVLIKS